jgi:hypothetical protein
MGRRAEGDVALTGAERQARYRLRLDSQAPRPASPKPSRGPTLGRRWAEAVAALVSLQAAYGAWLEALPEATRNTATGEALQAIVDLDLDDLIAIQPPRGFGRD